jgi:hypothetical protein
MNRIVVLSLAEQWCHRWPVGRCRLRRCVACVDVFRNIGGCGRGSRLRHSLRAALTLTVNLARSAWLASEFNAARTRSTMRPLHSITVGPEP